MLCSRSGEPQSHPRSSHAAPWRSDSSTRYETGVEGLLCRSDHQVGAEQRTSSGTGREGCRRGNEVSLFPLSPLSSTLELTPFSLCVSFLSQTSIRPRRRRLLPRLGRRPCSFHHLWNSLFLVPLLLLHPSLNPLLLLPRSTWSQTETSERSTRRFENSLHLFFNHPCYSLPSHV